MKHMRVVSSCLPVLLMAASIVPRVGLNAAWAQVKPGDVITPDNAARVGERRNATLARPIGSKRTFLPP